MRYRQGSNSGAVLVLLTGIVAFLGVMTACVADYAKSEPRMLDAVIQDKEHIPGHYETDCWTDSEGRRRCEDRWVPDSWVVLYTDEEGGHRESVNRAVYQSLRAGQAVRVQFYQGRYFRARYLTRFETGQMRVEKW